MKILVSAFDPFGGDEKNSSLMVLEGLHSSIDNIEIEKLIIPTVYGKCARAVWERANAINADAILCLGQAGGRRVITVEVIGVNYAHAHMADNEGVVHEGIVLNEVGEAAYFATVPVKEMVAAVKHAGFEADLSVSAGGFVCNSLLYTLLKNADDEGRSIPIGFVHLPYEVSQGKEGFSMTRKDMVICVEEMIKVIKNSERI